MGTLTDTNYPGKDGLGSNGNEGLLHNPEKIQDWSIAIRCILLSYLGHSMGKGSYPYEEMQSVYSTVPA